MVTTVMPWGVAALVERDGGDDREEDAVGRRSQAGVEDALYGDRDQPRDRADADPEHRAVIGAKLRGDRRDAGGDGQCRGHREQQAAFSDELQVFVVRVVEKELSRSLLVDEHAALERAGADPGEREV